jgi:hypothetical protein
VAKFSSESLSHLGRRQVEGLPIVLLHELQEAGVTATVMLVVRVLQPIGRQNPDLIEELKSIHAAST